MLTIAQPDEKTLRQACARTRQVVVYAYGALSTEVWWANQRQSLDRLKNLSVTLLPMDGVHALWIADGAQTLPIELQRLKV